ncbi:hypothetical protein JCM9279_004877 [Rhodotorula babjevae]
MDASFESWQLSLAEVAPNLDTLIVESEWWLRPVLENAPPRLRNLEVHMCADDAETISDLLPPLRHLQSLALHPSSFIPSELPSDLCRLDHLEHLILDYGPQLSNILMHRLVEGRHRLEHLRRLEIHEFDFGCEYGPTFKSEGYVLPRDDERDESGLWRGWVAPTWPEGLSEDGLSHAIAIARARGIEVSLSPQNAIEWRAAFEKERRRVALYRGLVYNDWADATRFLGEAGLNKVLGLWRREGWWHYASFGRTLARWQPS